jgi:hypothetical protein
MINYSVLRRLERIWIEIGLDVEMPSQVSLLVCQAMSCPDAPDALRLATSHGSN